MLKKMSAWVLFFGIVYPLSAAADDSLVKFKGGIGVIPVSSGVGAAATAEVVNRNIVRGVQPPGQIWVIADLRAEVKADGLGSIKVKGKGLLLGGGNNIGGNANASVFATLICQVTASDGTVSFTLHNTDSDDFTAGIQGVPLEPNGDFRIDDTLSPVPSVCANPVLLIRNAANQSWFAAGIPSLGNDD
jgi:hypothetical protein